MTTLDIGYAAGIIDSRGHISLTGRRGILTPRLRVTTRRHEIIEWLANRTGTTIHTDQRGYNRRGCSEHCEDKHQHLVRNSAYWNVDGARAVIVMYACLPYLVCQLEVVHDALSQARIYWPDSPTTQITEQMRRLGWTVPQRDQLPGAKFQGAS